MPEEFMLPAIVAIIGGLGASALRLPPLVGFLAAGFGLSAANVPTFPAIAELAEVGVTVLLFTIGLHLDLKMITRVRVVFTAVGQAALNTIVFAVVLAALSLLPLSAFIGTGWSGFLLLGFASSFSSTVFVIAVLDESGRMRSRVGIIAIGVLVLQDIFAVSFLVLFSGKTPEPWAILLLALPLIRPLIGKLPDLMYRAELLVLAGVIIAVGAYAVFELAGLSGSFGSLIAGLVIAGHPIAKRLHKALVSVRELLLVGFFIDIGMGGIPSMSGFIAAGILLLLLPAKLGIFLALLYKAGMSRRTSVLTAGLLANYSEFGLIVASLAAARGIIAGEWVQIMAVAVAGSFIISSLVKLRVGPIMEALVLKLPRRDPQKLAAGERPLDIDGVDALVLGMGRVGAGAYLRLAEKYGMTVAGVEFDEKRVELMRKRGYTVFHADATDPELWVRLSQSSHCPKLLVLAMPSHESNVVALQTLNNTKSSMVTAGIAKYSYKTKELVDLGADASVNLYDGAGIELADVAFQALVANEETPN